MFSENKTENETALNRRREKDDRIESHQSGSLNTLAYGSDNPLGNSAIEETIDSLSTTHAERLNTLMTLNFQQFEDVSLMAA